MNFHNWSETMEPDVGSVLEFLKEVANKRSNSKGTTFVMCKYVCEERQTHVAFLSLPLNIV